MKVAVINAVARGSTGKIMLQIGETARTNNIVCKTFSSKRASNNEKTTNHFYIDNKFEYIINQVVGYYTGFEAGCVNISTRRLINKLKKFNPNIIHLHILHGYYINYSMLFKYIKKHNIRVVWTLHDCWSFTGRCPHFQLTGCDKWKTGCSECIYDRKNYPASLWFDRSKKNWLKKKETFTGVNDLTIVTPSKWLADLVKESYLNEYPIKVINNGIDLSVFKPTESDFRKKYNCEDKYLLLGVANSWGVRKGLDVFVVLSQRLDDRFKIVLVGTNDKIDKELPKNIISIHRTGNQQELAEIYTAADLFVNPTREDTYPTVNMESLACGTPVLTFDTGGSSEIIDETCGVAVPKDDEDTLYNEIIRMCAEDWYSKENCIKKAETFNINNRYKEYLELYSKGEKRCRK